MQLLQNGGFELGTSSWAGQSISTSDCAARSGSAALALNSTGSQQAVAQQMVSGVAGGLGPYSLSGFSKLGSGSPSATIYLRFLATGGASLAEYQSSLPLGGSYAGFSAGTPSAPAGAVSIAVRIVTTGNGRACVDDLSLEGPAPVTATPSSTPTPTWTPTEAPTATFTRTATSVPATHTPRPPTATSAPSQSSSAASPGGGGSSGGAATNAAAIPFGELVNGGFESGVSPWQKFGGELQGVGSPTNSGAGAGAFSSATTSTKWAYQIVGVVPGETYAFSGYVQPGAGIAETYLRISWYESADGSGRTIGSVDSTERLSSSGGGFAYLTSGSVAAPAGAGSARVRVMLAPAGASPAVIYMDDLAFGPSQEPARGGALMAPSALDDESENPPPDAASTSSGVPGGGMTSPGPDESGAASEPPAQEADAAGAQDPQGAAPLPETAPAGRNRDGRGPLLYVALGSLLTAAGVGSAVWYTGRSPGRRG